MFSQQPTTTTGKQTGKQTPGTSTMRVTMRPADPLIFCVCLISICVVLGAEVGLEYGFLRVPAGILVSFWVPGYAALFALNTLKQSRTFTLIQHIVWSVPLSFGFAVLLGTILNSSPLGVRSLPTVWITCFVSSGLLALSWWRIVVRSRAAIILLDRTPRPGAGIRWRRLALAEQMVVWLLLGALSVATVWAGYGIVWASRDLVQPYTELYVTEIPTVTNGDTPTGADIRVNVRNNEARTMSFELRLVVQRRDGTATLAPTQQVLAAANETWEGSFRVAIRCYDQVEAQLWLPDEQEPYRTVRVRPVCRAS